MSIKFYTLEKLSPSIGKCRYRFRSLFNNCVGSWHELEENAIGDGNKHEEVVLFLYDKSLKLKEPEKENVDS